MCVFAESTAGADWWTPDRIGARPGYTSFGDDKNSHLSHTALYTPSQHNQVKRDDNNFVCHFTSTPILDLVPSPWSRSDHRQRRRRRRRSVGTGGSKAFFLFISPVPKKGAGNVVFIVRAIMTLPLRVIQCRFAQWPYFPMLFFLFFYSIFAPPPAISKIRGDFLFSLLSHPPVPIMGFLLLPVVRASSPPTLCSISQSGHKSHERFSPPRPDVSSV